MDQHPLLISHAEVAVVLTRMFAPTAARRSTRNLTVGRITDVPEVNEQEERGRDRNATTTTIISAEGLENAQEEDENTDYVCMMAITDDFSSSTNNALWHIDSGSTAYMKFDKSRFLNNESVIYFFSAIGR